MNRTIQATSARTLLSVSWSMRRSSAAQRPGDRGFTLVELIMVMALLALVTGLAAPSLSRSLRQRHLNEEATRFLALTEYGRDEAVSQGVPMIVWVDPNAQQCGVRPKTGFSGDESRNREFTLDPDVFFKLDKVLLAGGVGEAVEFAPDGAPGVNSVESLQLVDRFQATIGIVQTPDRWSYELVKEAP